MNVNFVEKKDNLIIIKNNKAIAINKEIIEIFKKYLQDKNYKKEAGGILVGRENNEKISIDFATEPMKKDKRKKNRFYRKDLKHIDFFNNIREIKGNIYGYIGEWHTHYEEDPTPSSIDIENWNNILKESEEEKYSTINIIVGINFINFFICDSTGIKVGGKMKI